MWEVLLVICLDAGDRTSEVEYSWLVKNVQAGVDYYGNSVTVLYPKPRMRHTSLDTKYNEIIAKMENGHFNEIWFMGYHLPHSGCIKLLIDAAGKISASRKTLVNYTNRGSGLDGFLRIFPQVNNLNGVERNWVRKITKLFKP